MADGISKTQVDKLGERLKAGDPSAEDIIILNEFRNAFTPALSSVMRTLLQLNLEPAGRSSKSTQSIVEKLRRETIRLSQMQDIAGCRIIAESVPRQNAIVRTLRFHHQPS